MGYHEPMHDPSAEVSPAFTVFRELYEELFGGTEHVRLRTLARPQLFYRGNRPLEWLRAHASSFDLVLTAVGINLLLGNYEFTYVLVVDDTHFWDQFGPDLIVNWETEHGQALDIVSSRDGGALLQRLSARNWAGSALMAFVEGLDFLAATRPTRVVVPSGFALA
jgi:hypothetical protein